MKKSLAAAALSAAILLAGCAQQPVPQPEPIALDQTPYPGVTVNYADENIARGLTVTAARLTKVGTLPKLSLTFKNLTQIKFPVEYQIQWLDASGAPLMTSSGWQRLTMTGNVAKSLTSVAKGQDAVSCNISVRLPVDVEIIVPTPDPAEVLRAQQELQQNSAVQQ